MLGDLSVAITELVSGSFKVAVQLAAPFYVLALLFFVCLGVLARLMPQLQIFFIGLPIQIYVGMLLLATILGALMTAFLPYYADTASTYLIPNCPMSDAQDDSQKTDRRTARHLPEASTQGPLPPTKR